MIKDEEMYLYKLSLDFDLTLDECDSYIDFYNYISSKSTISRDTVELLTFQPMFACESFNINSILRNSEDSKELINNLKVTTEGVLLDIWNAIINFFKRLFGISEKTKEKTEEIKGELNGLGISRDMDNKVAEAIKDELSKVKIIDVPNTDIKSYLDNIENQIKEIIETAKLVGDEKKDKQKIILDAFEDNLSKIKEAYKGKIVPASNFIHIEDMNKYAKSISSQGIDKDYNVIPLLEKVTKGTIDTTQKSTEKFLLACIRKIKSIEAIKKQICKGCLHMYTTYSKKVKEINKENKNDNDEENK